METRTLLAEAVQWRFVPNQPAMSEGIGKSALAMCAPGYGVVFDVATGCTRLDCPREQLIRLFDKQLDSRRCGSQFLRASKTVFDRFMQEKGCAINFQAGHRTEAPQQARAEPLLVPGHGFGCIRYCQHDGQRRFMVCCFHDVSFRTAL